MAVLHRSHRDSYDIGHFAANGWPAVSWPLVAALAVAGLAIGWGPRGGVGRLAVNAGQPAQVGCPACGHPILAPGGRLRSAPAPSGRCPACRARVGPPPFAVEVSPAVLLGVLAVRVHRGLVLAAACWLAVCTV